jgi:hypothetical protein
MGILVIEADPRQASAIRHIVCDLIKTKLTLVDSIAAAVDALATDTPELILLPPIISAADEAELRRALRRLPAAAHVEMQATPMLETPGQTTHAAEQARGRRPAGLAVTHVDADVQAFAAQVSSCLERARSQQKETEAPAKHRSASRRDAAAAHAAAPARPAPVHYGAPRRHARVAGPFDGFRRGAIDTPVRIQDVSEGGCFVNSVHSNEGDGEVTLAIQLSDENWITVKGEIVRSVAGFGFGVQFLELPDGTRAELAAVIAERGHAPELVSGF